jgi:hypothetical protein
MTAGAETDPYWANVVLLMHMDDSNFLDEKGHTVTKYGGITTAAGKFGSAAYSDGTGDFLSVNPAGFDLRTDYWTVEFFWKPAVMETKALLFETDTLFLTLWNTGVVSYAKKYSGTYAYLNTPVGTVDTSKFYHIAVVRNEPTTTIYVDGVNKASAEMGTFDGSGDGNLLILASHVDGSNCHNGSMDELRITKGVARYTANFTPPTAPFPNS